jgi:CRISPR type IV-associated protein Csf3
MGTDKIGRVDISGGANKGSRVPFRADLVGKLEWWCLGDPELIRHLLSFVHYLGDRRGHGLGRLVLHDRPWTVEECEPWEGFPLVRDGLPTRPLPPDWPGLQDPQLGYRTISYPYWARHSSELCAVPVH